VRFNSTGKPGMAEFLYDYNKATYIHEQAHYRSL
jgi:hypothetical protein